MTTNELREKIAHTLNETTGLRWEEWVGLIGVRDEYMVADAIMKVVSEEIASRDAEIHHLREQLLEAKDDLNRWKGLYHGSWPSCEPIPDVSQDDGNGYYHRDGTHHCPHGHKTTYHTLSGGREWDCETCDTTGSYPAGPGGPRARLLQQPGGAEELRRQMREHLADLSEQHPEQTEGGQ